MEACQACKQARDRSREGGGFTLRSPAPGESVPQRIRIHIAADGATPQLARHERGSCCQLQEPVQAEGGVTK